MYPRFVDTPPLMAGSASCRAKTRVFNPLPLPGQCQNGDVRRGPAPVRVFMRSERVSVERRHGPWRGTERLQPEAPVGDKLARRVAHMASNGLAAADRQAQ